MADTYPGMPAAPATDVEQIIPPEQAPMDDAAGGPQAEDANAPVEMPGENQSDGEATDPQVPTEDSASAETSAAHPS